MSGVRGVPVPSAALRAMWLSRDPFDGDFAGDLDGEDHLEGDDHFEGDLDGDPHFDGDLDGDLEGDLDGESQGCFSALTFLVGELS